MRTVLPGLHLLPLGIVNAYLCETPQGLVLIDAGVAGSGPKILKSVAALGRDLKHVVVTHAHPDHVGGLAEIAAATGAESWMHALDAPLAERGEMRPVRPAPGLLPKLMYAAMKILPMKSPPARVDHRIEGDDVALPFGDMRAIQAPGHCLGQIALLWPSRRVLFAADACMNLRGPRISLVNEDLALARASLRKVAALDFEIACFGHGAPILSGAAAALRRAAVAR